MAFITTYYQIIVTHTFSSETVYQPQPLCMLPVFFDLTIIIQLYMNAFTTSANLLLLIIDWTMLYLTIIQLIIMIITMVMMTITLIMALMMIMFLIMIVLIMIIIIL